MSVAVGQYQVRWLKKQKHAYVEAGCALEWLRTGQEHDDLKRLIRDSCRVIATSVSTGEVYALTRQDVDRTQ